MKNNIDIKYKKAILIVSIVFVSIVSSILACVPPPPPPNLVWTKLNANFTQEEWARDKYDCMQQSQQAASYAGEGYYIGGVYFPGHAQSAVVTNPVLLKACLEARGWNLVEDRVVDNNQNMVSVYFNSGYSNDNRGNYEKAVEDYSKAISMKPDYADAYYNRGLAYFKQDHYNLGCDDVRKACVLGKCEAFEWAKGKNYCH